MINDENEKLKKAYNLAIKENLKNTIGLMQEHTLHRVIKFYLSSDEANHEIKINHRFADVKIDNHIYEVQTKSFNLLKEKLNDFLQEYEVTIVYPMAKNKIINLCNKEGEIISIKKSPKHLEPLEICYELYKIKKYLLYDNLHLKILMLDITEFRTIKDSKRRIKSIKENQIPTSIEEIYDFDNASCLKKLLVNNYLKEPFTSTDFALSYHLPKKKVAIVLNVLTYLKIVNRTGKIKNSYLYEVNKNS